MQQELLEFECISKHVADSVASSTPVSDEQWASLFLAQHNLVETFKVQNMFVNQEAVPQEDRKRVHDLWMEKKKILHREAVGQRKKIKVKEAVSSTERAYLDAIAMSDEELLSGATVIGGIISLAVSNQSDLGTVVGDQSILNESTFHSVVQYCGTLRPTVGGHRPTLKKEDLFYLCAQLLISRRNGLGGTGGTGILLTT